MPPWWHTPSGERGATVIAGVLHNQKRFIESGVVYNRGAIANLPSNLAVEVPIVVDAAGVHPVSHLVAGQRGSTNGCERTRRPGALDMKRNRDRGRNHFNVSRPRAARARIP